MALSVYFLILSGGRDSFLITKLLFDESFEGQLDAYVIEVSGIIAQIP